MDKNAIKKFALWARRELIEKVTQKAAQYEVVDGVELDPDAKSVNGELLSDTERKQRSALVRKIQQDGFSQVMEEVAYTWFNRFIALRFMEVNGYLPTHVRIFTDDDNSFRPQILSEAINLDIDGLDKEKVYALKDASQDEELFRYLLITQCNALNSILPGMFQKIADYTELLLPDYLLREGSVIEQMIAMIPEEDWTDQVQIIGWLYQYYNSEPKDQVFADLKKNKKITKEKIPAATQLFTPDWIVRYMVENSLGRLWLEGHPANKDKFIPTQAEQDEYIKNHNDDGKWHYYLEEAEQEPEVQKQLDEIHQEYSALKPEDILCIDPCMGSGHILCYLFDTLVKIYEDYGYSAREAAGMIVENNIWGLDIDYRAAQLAYFAVMMKARQYDRRFFTRGIQPHVYAIQESNHINMDTVAYFANGDADLQKAIDTIISELHDAKEYGSILTVTEQDFSSLYARFDEIRKENLQWSEDALTNLLPLVECAQALAQKYHVVVTNPPYMSLGNASSKLSNYIKDMYSISKIDLFSVLTAKGIRLLKNKGLLSLITQQSMFFLSGLSDFRADISKNNTIVNAVHMGLGAFGNDFGTAAFLINNVKISNYNSLFISLGKVKSVDEKELMLISGNSDKYTHKVGEFLALPNKTFSYTITGETMKLFTNDPLKKEFISGGRNKTHNDEKYLRMQWEIDSLSDKWEHYGKGGEFRRWYGDIIYVVNWSEPARAFYASHGGLCNKKFWNKTGITWSFVTSYKPSFRYKPYDMIYSSVSPTIFRKDFQFDNYVIGLLNSIVGLHILRIISSTIGTNVGEVLEFPLIRRDDTVVSKLTENCIDLSKTDWDSYETSWDFKGDPMIFDIEESDVQISATSDNHQDSEEAISDLAPQTSHLTSPTPYPLIKDSYELWKKTCNTRFSQLKQNEEELNRIFIDIYSLQDELTPEESDKDVTVHRVFDSADEVPEEMKGSNYVRTKRDEIVSFISYAVGCMFGRYRLDRTGLAFAGGDWDEYLKENPYPDSATSDLASHTFLPDKDAIIPICDDEYFSDDIVGRFVEFVRVVYGADTLEENLRFIADALGGDGISRDVIRNYFMNDFYKDHCKIYQKRPVYWLFDSGKKNGFKCLIYMHRYRKDTIARIRTDYVYEQQSRYDTAIEDVERRLVSAEGSDKVKLNKRLKKLTEQSEELHNYEEKIHHLADQMISIDLDDGVKHNYAIFQYVLAKLK